MTRLVSEILVPMGYELDVTYVPWARVYVEKEKYDLVLGVWPEEVRKMNLEGFLPLFLSRMGFFVRSGSQIDVSSLTALGDRAVGITRGYGYPRMLFQSKLHLDPANDDLTNFRKLIAGRFDLFTTEQAVGEYLLMVVYPELHDKIVWKEPAYAEIPLGVAVVSTSGLKEKLKHDLVMGVKSKRKGWEQLIIKEYGVALSVSIGK